MDSPTPLSSQPAPTSPTLAAAGTVLPHDDTQSTQLAHQASHLTLSTQMPQATTPTAAVSPVVPPPAEPPYPAPKRTRACSASCTASSDGSPPLQRPRQASAPIGPFLLLPATTPSNPGSAGDAQPAPPISPPPYEHSRDRGGSSARNVGDAACQQVMDWPKPMLAADHALGASDALILSPAHEDFTLLSVGPDDKVTLAVLPNEVLLHVLGFLDVSDLLSTSRTSHQFRSLALAPILHRLRLRHARNVLPPLLTSPSRPTLKDLMHRSIFMTKTTVVSRRLSRSLTAIRLSRRLAARPEPETLVARSVLPPECVPFGSVAPGLVAKKRAVEREQVRDGMRRWVGGVWERRWREKAEDRRRWEERSGVGRVWRLRRFWERVGKGEIQAS
ncbi:hypothetical protein N8I77_011302 [Diaporthe amygdali]|uniref:F-box domain-containing protein n=1 Tax=Phomopsis amygdali TaxID=1214568 RepID=A0AAD9S549_PHOAM|nr:hypothetical protein N8I77_011302 [Diaporthe amygdali]KAK2599560.1 hypothetical protein N8I77_011302 [Diaporthe amygdali]